ncbi:MAG: efflux RND transporter permease subunit [Sandaracinaceae bacterium]|nr:efflux RND transporter permease subunit [Sandaracinaceae bacterium]
MQWLARICVRRPVFTWVMMLGLVVVGGASLFGLGVDRFPKIDFPMVVVSTRLPGASPEQVETEVTDPIEEAVNSIAGIDELISVSYEGLSVVMVRFSLETDIEQASNDVRDRVSRTLAQLPSGIEQPQIQRMDPDAAPIMQLALISTRSSRETTDYADRVLRRRLETVGGVGGVTISGGRERELQVTVEPTALASFGLTARDVQRALATENVEMPGGDVQQGTRTVQLRVQGRVQSPEDLALLPIVERQDRVIRVGDVARVEDAEAEPTSAASFNGHEVVVVSVRKQSGANTVAVVDALAARVAEIQAELPPSYRIEIVRDESEFIRNAIHAVEEHLILGGLFAAIVVLLFLWNGRTTVIAALAIPTSIIATFAFIRAMGLTANVITLLGLTLSVGIVIDDAIVVMENIVRFIEEKGMSPRRAAVLATREIGLAVLATSLSLVAVFLPLAFMSGIVGRFMSSFGFTMSFAILVSLFVSFTLTPMLCARWLKGPIRPSVPPPEQETHDLDEELIFPDPAPGDRKEERAQYLAWMKGERRVEGEHFGRRGALYNRLEKAYMWLLAWSMRHRWAVAIVLVVTMAGMVPLVRIAPKNFLPNEDESRLEVTARAPEGTSLAQTQLIGERIARQIRALPGVRQTLVTTGSAPGDPSARGANQASIYVLLVPPSERALSQDAIVERVRDEVLPRFEAEHLRTMVGPISPFGGGGAASAPIQYVLGGPDMDRLGVLAERMLEGLRRVPGVTDADMTLVTGRPAYEVHVDRRRAADLGVSVADISTALRLMVGGVAVTTYAEGGEQYDVVLRADADWRADPQVISQITVPTATGRTVRLADVARIESSTGPSSIQHLNRQRQVTIYCSTLPGASEAAITAELDRIRGTLGLEPGYTAALTGRSRELGRAFESFLIAVLLSFTFMYLVLAAQFESWIHPVTILSSLPLTLPFAIFSVVVLGGSLNIYSMLGILVLFGIVKKNSILQIDHMRELRRKGLSRADAIMVGNRDRLRPILMTTMAFVAGMIPLLASSGAGAGTNRAMGTVIAGGQTLALVLTLIATPVIFSWLDDLANAGWVKAVLKVLTWPIRFVDRLVTRKDPHTPHVGEPAGRPAE